MDIKWELGKFPYRQEKLDSLNTNCSRGLGRIHRFLGRINEKVIFFGSLAGDTDGSCVEEGKAIAKEKAAQSCFRGDGYFLPGTGVICYWGGSK